LDYRLTGLLCRWVDLCLENGRAVPLAEFLKNLSREEQLCLLCALVDAKLRTAAPANLQVT
jgi:hypothetical protein